MAERQGAFVELVDPTSGGVRWAVHGVGLSLDAPVVAGADVYLPVIPSPSGALEVRRVADGQLDARIALHGEPESLTPVGAGVYVSGGAVTRVDHGRVTMTTPLPDASVNGLTVLGDGSVVVQTSTPTYMCAAAGGG